MTISANEALKQLIQEARGQRDGLAWAASLLKQTGDAPEDAHYFVETLNAAAQQNGAELLQSNELPRCSFCLKTSAQVRKMVSAPNANICDECSEIVRNTLAEKREKRSLFSLLTSKSR
jgi:hypothetical protein